MRYKMTNKDAIEVLEALKNEDVAIPRATFHKSLELAIDALQRTSNADEKHVGNTLEDAVSREKVLNVINLGWEYRKNCIEAIEKLPSVTRQTGKWILLDECANSGYYCSKCQKKLVKEGWSDTVKKIKFCPNCGADMNGADMRGAE